jgi:hypothetical protein
MTSPKTSPTASKKVEAVFDRAKTAVAREADAAKDEIHQAGERLREEASNIASKAKEAVSDRAQEGKETVAASITDFAAAVKRASDELGERDQSMAANLVREVASGLEQASRAIHGRSVGDLTRSVNDFARRQPAAFLLGATVAGIALGRFVKATEDRGNEGTGTTPSPAPAASATIPTSGGFRDR